MSDPLTLGKVLCEEFHALHPNEKAPKDTEAAFRQAVHALPKRQSALCLSGGGIRSATFSLGFMQALAEKGFLKHFDYLSTVSGGGYIGGWLSAWIKHQRDEASDTVTADDINDAQDAVHHLREYSNYLDPKLGLFSADVWTLGATYVRNKIGRASCRERV